MKKNYIAPSTVAATWASMGLMQDNIAFATQSVSGGAPTIMSTNDVNAID